MKKGSRRATRIPDELKPYRRKLRDADFLHVANEVAEAYNLHITDLCRQTHRRRIAEARQVAMFFHSFKKNVSFKAVGEIYGLRSCTVTYSRDTVEALNDVDKRFRERIVNIATSIVTPKPKEK